MVFKWKSTFTHIFWKVGISTHYEAAFLSGEAILISTDDLMDKVPMIVFFPFLYEAKKSSHLSRSLSVSYGCNANYTFGNSMKGNTNQTLCVNARL